jgi:type II secretory pathway pseudopilin PulG
MIVIAIIAIIAAIAIPNLIEARKGANESAAIGALRTIHAAQQIFRENDKDGNGTLDYATGMVQLQTAGLVDSILATGTKQGYFFEVVRFNAFEWGCLAAPLIPGKSGDRYFSVVEDGVIIYGSTTVNLSLVGTPVGG